MSINVNFSFQVKRSLNLNKCKKKTYAKRPESKHDDDEVDRVGEEHQHVDVCDCAVLRVDQVMEELPHGKVDLHEPAEKKKETMSKETALFVNSSQK